jgi:hypothetical protein
LSDGRPSDGPRSDGPRSEGPGVDQQEPGVDQHEPVDDPHTLSGEPATRPALVEALGGKRGMVDSGLPAVVFVFVHSVAQALADRGTALNAALVAAVATGVGIVGLRLVRRETLQQALSGFFALAVAVWFARRSGEARGFFLPGIYINAAYGTVFLVSALVGRPIVGAIYAAVDGLGPRWRTDPALRRVFAVASVGWALVFASRAVVQTVLYNLDRVGWLATSRLLMGWPLTIAAVALTVAYVRRAHARAAQRAAAAPAAESPR